MGVATWMKRWPGAGMLTLLDAPWDRLFFVLLAVAIFLTPFHQLTGVKNSLTFATLAFLLVRGWQHRHALPARLRQAPPLLWMGLYVGVALLSCLLAADPGESLRAFRSDLLKQLILGAGVFYFASRTGNGLFWLHLVLVSMAARSLYVAGEFLYYGQVVMAGNPLYREIHTVSHGFALDLSTLFPLLLGVAVLMWEQLSPFLRTLYFTTAGFGVWVLLQNESTTPLVLVAASLGLLLPLRPDRRGRLVVGLLLLGFLGAALASEHVRERIIAHHWNRLTSSSNWQGERAFNNRWSLWAAYLEVIRERPLLGHGIGLRQSATLFPQRAGENPVIRRMLELNPCGEKALQSGAPCDRQPHSTYLGLLFQSGWAGLLTWGGFLLSLLAGLARRRDPMARAMLLFWVLFLPGAFINGLWNGVIGKLLMVVAMAGVHLLTRPHEVRHDP